ncbi:MAG: hypothetical protein HYT62_03175 [Candidatus Yanofskybacteria bacterium]|nr:hypothetical protein [Candidatus Yanofskybacteria bacterium]
MPKSLVLLCLFLLFFSFPARVNAQDVTGPDSPDRPDVSSWTLVSSSNISVNVSDSVMYYLGFDLEFQNPNNPNERVRQIRMLIPFVVVKSKGLLDKNYADAAVAYVTDGTERALLKDYATKSDVILYIRWSIESDVSRGTKKLIGENEVWFWNASGEWVYGRNLRINKLMPSETFSGFGNYPIIVGVKYSLSRDIYNSTEVPYSFIFIALRATKGGK